MITSSLRLKKSSDTVYQEVSSNSQHRPIEWKESFHPINFDLIDVKSEYIWEVHEYQFIPLSEAQGKNSILTVKPNTYSIKRITGIVDKASFVDSIFCLVSDNDELQTFRVEQPKGDIKVVLQPEEISDCTEELKEGYYRGLCMRYDLDGNDHIYFELTLPESQFTEISNSLERNSKSKINLLIYLLSCTNEVDDAFREHCQPRDMIFSEITTKVDPSVQTNNH